MKFIDEVKLLIDRGEIKEAYRHLNVVCFTDFFDVEECDADKIGITEFFAKMYEAFKNYISCGYLDSPLLQIRLIDMLSVLTILSVTLIHIWIHWQNRFLRKQAYQD